MHACYLGVVSVHTKGTANLCGDIAAISSVSQYNTIFNKTGDQIRCSDNGQLEERCCYDDKMRFSGDDRGREICTEDLMMILH